MVDFHSAPLLFSCCSLFLPPEMDVNITGDEYRSIFISLVLRIFPFWPFLAIFLAFLAIFFGIFGIFCHFLGFSGDLGLFGSASEL